MRGRIQKKADLQGIFTYSKEEGREGKKETLVTKHIESITK